MAQARPYHRSFSNPASRLAYQRPWLLVLAALAGFALYVANGGYSFAPALNDGSPAPVQQPAEAAPVTQTERVIETSALVVSAEPDFTGRIVIGVPQQAAPVAEAQPEAVTTAETTSAAVEQPSTAATNEQLVAEPAPAVLPQVEPVAPSAPAGLTPAGPTAASLAQRWAPAGIVIVSEGQAWDDASLRNVDAALSALPPAVLSQLGNPALGDLHILVNTEGRSLDGSQPYGGAANYFSTNQGINQLVLFPGQRVTTVLHELGHAYNLRNTPAGAYAQVLLTPEMQSFLAATGWQTTTPDSAVAATTDHTAVGYEYTGSFRWAELSNFDPLEDYANSFALYIADPERLRAMSPERFRWMAANLPG